MRVKMEPTFWAAWKDGMDYPNLYTTEVAAKDYVKATAKKYPGETVYLLKLEQVGSLTLPEKFKSTGAMKIDGE
jgi:hypothetical protein